MYRARQASGHNRTDWVVKGPCECASRWPDEQDWIDDGCPDCPYCDGTGTVVVVDDLDQGTALMFAEIWNHNEKRVPFNPPRITTHA